MAKEQDSYDCLFIGDDSFLLNNLISEYLKEEQIPTIFCSAWDYGKKYLMERKVRLVIIDSKSISKLDSKEVLSVLRRSKADLFLFNVTSGTWVAKIVERLKEGKVFVYKRPIYIDRLIKAVKGRWEKRSRE